MNKVQVIIFVPMLDQEYEVLIPCNKKVGNVVKLAVKAISDLSDNAFPLKNNAILYNQQSGQAYDFNQTIRDCGIRNGTKLILI